MDSVSNGFGHQEFSMIREETITRPTVETVSWSRIDQDDLTSLFINVRSVNKKAADLWRFGASVRSRTDRESNGAYFPYSKRAEPMR
jgi:hypothetical protein